MSVELKMRPLTAEEIGSAAVGTVVSYGGNCPDEATWIVTDSREAGAGCLFCAIPGERFDGHDYIAGAVRQGCRLVLCQRVPAEAEALCFTAVLVEDTVAAMGRLAGWYRSLLPLRVAAVTGSVGKTTTKELLAAVLSARYRTHKTEGNRNNTIGLPLTVLGLSPQDEVAVLEMGMNHFGEIGQMSRCARPDVGVITNVGTAHLEFLGSREGICQAKMEMAEGMTPGQSVLWLNGDEPLLRAHRADALVPRYFGLGEENDCRAVNLRETEEGVRFDATAEGQTIRDLFVPARGLHHVMDALAAVAVGLTFGLSAEEIRRGLAAYVPAAMRQKMYKSGAILVIEDCYNANPESMKAALEVLLTVAAERGGRPCALLGDMLELGPQAAALHEEIGRYAASRGVGKLFCYGPLAEKLGEAASSGGVPTVLYSTDTGDPQRMASILLQAAEAGDVLLVKASRGIAAEEVLGLCRKVWEAPDAACEKPTGQSGNKKAGND